MMKAQLTLAFALLLVCTGGGAALAQTPDGQPPSSETVCDNETGAAYGLCNAYCEAMDCELANDGDPSTNPHASATACNKVRSKFQNITGREVPCEVPPVACPCNDVPGRFQDVVAGQFPIAACYIESGGIAVELVGSPSLLRSTPSGDQWTCRDMQFGGIVLDISPEQGQFCADLLEQAANSQSVTCQEL
jgi:hypothetical protein